MCFQQYSNRMKRSVERTYQKQVADYRTKQLACGVSSVNDLKLAKKNNLLLRVKRSKVQ